MIERRCKDWIHSLAEYVAETESPRHFWLWGALFTLTSALQRKVWVPFGIETIFPNLYILLIAPPGKCRKGAPLSLAKRMLTDIEVPVSVDSLSKRALTKEMHAIGKNMTFRYEGKHKAHCSVAVVSKELSSLLAVDPKGMIECLTDLYDAHETWKYATSGEGSDFLFGVCVNCFLGSTPRWIANNLPEDAIGGGLWSRLAVIVGYEKYKRITLPPTPPEELYKNLLHDLAHISTLVGAFMWDEEGYRIFDEWYQKLDSKYREVKDENLHSFLERIHIMVLKCAMALRVSYSDELILTPRDIGLAIGYLDTVLATAGDALAGHGKSTTSAEVEKVITQIHQAKIITTRELLQMNYRNTNASELRLVLETVTGMGVAKAISFDGDNTTYEWVGSSLYKRKRE